MKYKLGDRFKDSSTNVFKIIEIDRDRQVYIIKYEDTGNVYEMNEQCLNMFTLLPPTPIVIPEGAARVSTKKLHKFWDEVMEGTRTKARCLHVTWVESGGKLRWCKECDTEQGLSSEGVWQ